MNQTGKSLDKKWMRRALDLAEKGKGQVEPNPMVGCVIVRDGEVVGEGHHKTFGEAHAEVHALEEAGNRAAGASMFVTLEPCSTSRKTPPCTEKIIKAGIDYVHASVLDPDPDASGQGIKELRDAGIEVETGLLEEEAAYLNRRFLTCHVRNRPYIVAKWAMSYDGKIATRTGDSQWITSRRARRRARSLRTEEGAVMVGIGTVTEDNPTLLGPEDDDRPEPVRIIVDSRIRLRKGFNIINTANKSRTILATREGASDERKKELEEAGLEIIEVPSSGAHVDFQRLCHQLAEENLQSILVEGGGTLLGTAFEVDVIDEVKIFIAPKIIGGSRALTPIEGEGIQNIRESPELSEVRAEWLDPDLLIEALYRDPPIPNDDL